MPPARRVLFDIYLPWACVNICDEIPLKPKPNIYTRLTDPFNPERVAEVVWLVKIGPDLTDDQRGVVRAFVEEYADVFALSVGEVKVVDGPGYAPTLPDNVAFSTGPVPQRPWMRPQAIDVNRQVDELVAAGVLQRMDPHAVKLQVC
ncbi:hypothetical protein C8R47DRAFT_976056 [Mycena vitilis]|nr:hypothetical protein C8R47DRAFT_976056 [Mycena vitilis]